MTIYQSLDVRCRKALHEYCISRYLDGECYVFALALHRGLGWPLVGLKRAELIRHAAVLSPGGMPCDARGQIDTHEFLEPFVADGPCTIQDISEGDLLASGKVSEHGIEVAGRLAGVLWPELPWGPTSYGMRMSAFAEELEKISRRHGLWIYGGVSTFLPLIADGHGDELGYAIKPTADGLCYTINRRLGDPPYPR